MHTSNTLSIGLKAITKTPINVFCYSNKYHKLGQITPTTGTFQTKGNSTGKDHLQVSRDTLVNIAFSNRLNLGRFHINVAVEIRNQIEIKVHTLM